jgi:colicin import membrane protein
MPSKQNSRKSFFISVIFHVIILTVLIVSFEFNSQSFVLENSNDPHIVNAVILNDSKVHKASPTPVSAKAREVAKKIEPPKPVVKPPKPVPTPPVARPVEPVLPPPRITKKVVTPPIEKKAIAIPDKKKKIQKELLEKDLLAELEQTKKLKKQKELVKQTVEKHNEIEKEFQKELKAAKAAKALQQEMKSEQDQLSSSESQKMRGVIDKYKALILQSIAQHWLVPTGVDKTLSSELLIRVASGGTVLDVQLVKSSGDDALDRSARTAVFKASPLPVPSDATEFGMFKEFILKVKPENVLARDNGLG